MSNNLPSVVNRKQFHFLLNQFLAEHRLQDKWFLTSSNYKIRDDNRRATYNRYNVKGDENYSDFIYKCIDVYVGETIERDWGYYSKTIRGFFRSFLLEVVMVLNGIVFGRLILSYGRK